MNMVEYHTEYDYESTGMVDLEHYINDFEYDMVVHDIDYANSSMEEFIGHTIDGGRGTL
jgi:hypothetical protein